MKKLVAIVIGLLPILSWDASARTQTMLMGKNESPFSVNGGVLGNGAAYDTGADRGYGLKGLGGDVGFSHYVGHDFEYGLDIAGAYSTNIRGKLFDEKIKNGFRSSVTLAARYLPQLSDNLRLGGLLEVGYSRLFGDANKSFHDAYTFGDLSFNVGPAFTHHVSESLSWGMGLTYGLSEMRFGGQNISDRLKQYSSLHTVRLPIDFLVQATEKLGIAVGLESGWRHLGSTHKFHHGIYNELSLGFVYQI